MALFSVCSERQSCERLGTKPLALVAALLLVVACGGAATSIPEPTPTATPTATPPPPAEQTDRLRDLGDPRLTDISEKMESVEPVWTVYFHSEDWRTPGRNTLINDVFELVKLENIATHDGYKEISPETVVALEPDIIVADSIESIIENPDLSGLHMVQDTDHIPHHIFVLSEGLSFSFDNPRFMKAVKELAVFPTPRLSRMKRKRRRRKRDTPTRKGRHTRISDQEHLWEAVKCQHSLGRFDNASFY